MSEIYTLPKAHGIIPARYASARFPGKPLLLLHGKPMFLHVWERASRCPLLESVTLATDDERILRAAEAHGVPCVMTAKTHESGTDRVHEAAEILGIPESSLVVNIQGDEPALDPAALTVLINCFSDSSVRVATLAHPLKKEDLNRPDKVKAVTAANGDALYFSRSPLPFARDREYAYSPLGHIGLYAFTMNALKLFVSLPPSSLELTERLEQLRLLENGISIRVAVIESGFQGVDSESDVPAVLALLQK